MLREGECRARMISLAGVNVRSLGEKSRSSAMSETRKTCRSAHVKDCKDRPKKHLQITDTTDMGVTRKRSADEARAGGSRPERSFPKKEYPKKEYAKKEGGDHKAKKTPLVCALPFCSANAFADQYLDFRTQTRLVCYCTVRIARIRIRPTSFAETGRRNPRLRLHSARVREHQLCRQQQFSLVIPQVLVHNHGFRYPRG